MAYRALEGVSRFLRADFNHYPLLLCSMGQRVRVEMRNEMGSVYGESCAWNSVCYICMSTISPLFSVTILNNFFIADVLQEKRSMDY